MAEEKLSKKEDLKMVEKLAETKKSVINQLKKIIVGQERVIEEVLICLFSKGHCLIVGVPGLAKTLLIESISRILDLNFRRIQFTPDLMPSDITGTEIIEEDVSSGKRNFRFIKGPIFANIILADEINRTPPKTQSALLQSMQEYKVTVGGVTYPLELPFFVLATQNPIEHEGTYPLPEAQLDRFFFNIFIDYPARNEEADIVKQTTGSIDVKLEPILNAKDILSLQEVVRKVPASDYVVDYAISLVEATRPKNNAAPDFIKEMISWGAGPRASQSLIIGAKARAILNGRLCASVEDVEDIAYTVLRHRIVLSFKAEAEGTTADTVIKNLLEVIRPK